MGFRPTADQKNRFEVAAALQGLSLVDFLIASAEESATKILRESTMIQLNGQARTDFISALSNPPEPNKKLRELAERYSRNVETR